MAEGELQRNRIRRAARKKARLHQNRAAKDQGYTWEKGRQQIEEATAKLRNTALNQETLPQQEEASNPLEDAPAKKAKLPRKLLSPPIRPKRVTGLPITRAPGDYPPEFRDKVVHCNVRQWLKGAPETSDPIECRKNEILVECDKRLHEITKRSTQINKELHSLRAERRRASSQHQRQKLQDSTRTPTDHEKGEDYTEEELAERDADNQRQLLSLSEDPSKRQDTLKETFRRLFGKES